MLLDTVFTTQFRFNTVLCQWGSCIISFSKLGNKGVGIGDSKAKDRRGLIVKQANTGMFRYSYVNSDTFPSLHLLLHKLFFETHSPYKNNGCIALTKENPVSKDGGGGRKCG